MNLGGRLGPRRWAGLGLVLLTACEGAEPCPAEPEPADPGPPMLIGIDVEPGGAPFYLSTPHGEEVELRDGRLTGSIHRGPVDRLVLVRRTADGRAMLWSSALVLTPPASQDALRGRVLPGRRPGGAAQKQSADDLEAWFGDVRRGAESLYEQAVDGVDTLRRSGEGSVREAIDRALEAIELIGRAHDEIRARVEQVLGTINATTLTLGFVTRMPPLRWTQQAPEGLALAAWQRQQMALDLALRETARQYMMLRVAGRLLETEAFWSLVEDVRTRGFAAEPFLAWYADLELLTAAVEVARGADQSLRAELPFASHDASCLSIPRTSLGAHAPYALRWDSYCATLHRVAVENAGNGEDLLEPGTSPYLGHLEPAAGLAELFELAYQTLFQLEGDNGLRDFVSVLPNLLSEGRLRSAFAAPAELALRPDVVAHAGALTVRWDNGWWNGEGELDAQRVFYGTPFLTDLAGLVERALELVLRAEEDPGERSPGMARIATILLYSYDLTPVSASAAIAPEALADWLLRLAGDPPARRAFVANALTMSFTVLNLALDAGQLLFEATGPLAFSVNLLLDIVQEILLHPDAAQAFAESCDPQCFLLAVPIVLAAECLVGGLPLAACEQDLRATLEAVGGELADRHPGDLNPFGSRLWEVGVDGVPAYFEELTGLAAGWLRGAGRRYWATTHEELGDLLASLDAGSPRVVALYGESPPMAVVDVVEPGWERAAQASSDLAKTLEKIDEFFQVTGIAGNAVYLAGQALDLVRRPSYGTMGVSNDFCME